MRRFIVGLPFIALTVAIASATVLFWSKSDCVHPANLERLSRAASCATCHPREFGEWSGSHHAWANRPVSPSLDREAFSRGKTITSGDTKTTPLLLGGQPAFRVEDKNGLSTYQPEMVIGVSPLRQYLIRFPGGRWQTQHISYDPRTGDWFDADAEVRQPRDWGHWTNRSMTWNVQCASCHTTGFQKNYDGATDSYHTSWENPGVSCARCHGNLDQHQQRPHDRSLLPTLTRTQAIDNCGSCHARREELTGTFKVGDHFFDHYRPTLVDDPMAYYPDGQINHEDFEYGSFLMSKMAHRGVTCLDCHNPHSGKTVLSWENNALCLQCHNAPGRAGAIPIDPAIHTHHTEGKPGSRCVDCHMPETPYMQRHLRRDHGFTSPDPLLTVEAGIPNACNRCHTVKDAAWSLACATEWYGDKLNRPARARALAVVRARQGDDTVVTDLIRLARAEEIPAWRASLLANLGPWAENAAVSKLAHDLLHDPHPLVRASAVALAGENSSIFAWLTDELADPSRLVRLDATAALWGRIQIPDTAQREFRAYLNNLADQPAGALRKSELALADDNLAEAELWAHRAASWDTSPEILRHLDEVLRLKNRQDHPR